ncbi:hypothetical protein SBD_2716 [Streptomyces bottropensis ATCC 25435]|uniref:Uncharacterized protein n=1 Tax=Streptomyces bottropensis ATCC 25435 TaxID=1054862 RepID=M3F1L2_9ACTN|nr:hypothetical protein SBD_2716 [Streptomyces bottropensis ATCC 25435]
MCHTVCHAVRPSATRHAVRQLWSRTVIFRNARVVMLCESGRGPGP